MARAFILQTEPRKAVKATEDALLAMQNPKDESLAYAAELLVRSKLSLNLFDAPNRRLSAKSEALYEKAAENNRQVTDLFKNNFGPDMAKAIMTAVRKTTADLRRVA